MFLISHKTRRALAGPAYDLHEWAWTFLRQYDLIGPPFVPDDIYFEPTLADKIARIASIGCAVFIDDLPEVLTTPDFPATTRAILFDPDDRHADRGMQRCRDWASIRRALA